MRLRTKLNYWVVVVAAVAGLVGSAAYYTILGGAWLRPRGLDPDTAELTPQVWPMLGQLARNLVVATVLAWLLRRLQAAGWKEAAGVGLLVWLGFQAMAVAGSVLHEGYPLGLYAIHVGDALLATLVMALILGAWRGTGQQQAETSSTVSPAS